MLIADIMTSMLNRAMIFDFGERFRDKFFPDSSGTGIKTIGEYRNLVYGRGPEVSKASTHTPSSFSHM